MRVLRDVVIQRTENDELQAVSHVAGIAGEDMTLDVMAAGTTIGLKVRVIDSRPVMVDGAVRHRIRLALVDVVDDAVVRSLAQTSSVAEAL